MYTPFKSHYFFIMKQLLVVLIFVCIGLGLYFYFLLRTPEQAEAPSVSTTTTQQSSEPVDDTSAASNKTYANQTFGFALQYPADITPTSTFATSYLATNDWSLLAQASKLKGSPVVSFTIPNSNEVESGQLRIGVSTGTTAAECVTAPKDSGVSTSSAVSILGQQFTRFTTQDAAMSHHLEAHVLRTMHNSMCYSLEEVVFGTDPEVYDPPRTVPFTADEAFKTLDSLLETFTFTQSTSTASGTVMTVQ